MDPITKFMQDNFSDQQVVDLLAHIQNGKLSYASCCCFIGIATADHGLRAGTGIESDDSHYYRARALPGALLAERVFAAFGDIDEERRLVLLPIVEAEVRRRFAVNPNDNEDRLEPVKMVAAGH